MAERLQATYLLPIRRTAIVEGDELAIYLEWLTGLVEVIVVDGSPPAVFDHHASAWPGAIRHLRPDPDLACPNGKVWGVNTGLRHASHARVVIADDDVRYDEASLRGVVSRLHEFHVVRPQNYFEPQPWHARWDTARTLINRAFGGDWPGTLALRADMVDRYDGDVMFENLELWRTVQAAGGRQAAPLDLYVLRRPPEASHFWSQRVRQAFDEFARPPVLLAELAVLPALFGLVLMRRGRVLLAGPFIAVAVAEYGRRLHGGTRYFPASASWLAPLWLLERGVCSWLAVWQRVRWGGVRYGGTVLPTAAHSVRAIRGKRAREAQEETPDACTAFDTHRARPYPREGLARA